MSTIKCKNKYTKNFRFHEETKQDIRDISSELELNHTELVEFGIEYIKKNKKKFKQFVANNKMKEVS